MRGGRSPRSLRAAVEVSTASQKEVGCGTPQSWRRRHSTLEGKERESRALWKAQRSRVANGGQKDGSVNDRRNCKDPAEHPIVRPDSRAVNSVHWNQDASLIPCGTCGSTKCIRDHRRAVHLDERAASYDADTRGAFLADQVRQAARRNWPPDGAPHHCVREDEE